MSNIFGVELTDHEVKVALVEKRMFKDATFVRAIRSSFDPDAFQRQSEKVKTVPEALLEAGYDSENDYLAVIFPADKITVKTFSTPLDNRKRILETLPYEVEAATPFSAEDIVADYMPFSSKSDDGLKSISACIAVKSDFEDFLSDYREAGLLPDIIIPVPSIHSMAAGLGGVTLIIDIGKTGVALSLIDNGDYLSYHFLDQNNAQSNGARLSESLIAAVKRVTLSATLTRPDIKIDKIVVVGDSDEANDIKDSLRNEDGYNDINISTFSTSSFFPQSDDSVSASGSSEAFAVSYAAALSYPQWQETRTMTFLQGSYEKKRTFTGSAAQGAATAGLAALVALLFVTLYLFENFSLSSENDDLTSQIVSEYKAAMKSAPIRGQAANQLTAELDRLRNKSTAIGAGLEGGDPLLDRLYEITNSIPKDVSVDIENMVYEPGVIILSGRTGSFEQVESLKNRFEKLAWTNKISVGEARAKAAGGVTFKIEMEISS